MTIKYWKNFCVNINYILTFLFVNSISLCQNIFAINASPCILHTQYEKRISYDHIHNKTNSMVAAVHALVLKVFMINIMDITYSVDSDYTYIRY